ncbi:putative polysaccharide biosynthesis protein CpsL [Vibrio chagasii]|nr:putative polysaccharide biosynthesis protein CpsL [Vibrio chagasii]CAH6942846.1 putative polysaccharide biosynthesis protein CpsL [Vibrio chagasii]CAH6944784.1 putative polysaccharide biosynthesis protein CpsL [Vibrio chagasii]
MFKNTSIYLFSNILNAAIPFILLPVLTRVLTQEEYGQIAMLNMCVSGLAAFVGINTIGYSIRSYYDNINESLLNNGAALYIYACSLIVVTLVVSIFNSIISNILSIPSVWVFFAVVIASSNFLLGFLLAQYQVREQAKYYGIWQVSCSIFNVALSILLIFHLDLGVDGRVYALLGTAIVVTALVSIFLYRKRLFLLGGCKFSHVKSNLSFGVPLIPHIFGFFLLNAADRYIIKDNLDLSSAGIYMVAVQLSLVFNIFFDAINKAFVPWLFVKLKNGNTKVKVKIVRLTYVYMVALLLLSVMVFFIAPPLVILIAGNDYKLASDIIGWICLGQIFSGMYLMVTNYIFFAKKTKLLSFVTLFSGAVHLTLLILLIDEYGLLGAAYAFAISKFIQFILTWILSMRAMPMPWFNLKQRGLNERTY